MHKEKKNLDCEKDIFRKLNNDTSNGKFSAKLNDIDLNTSE